MIMRTGSSPTVSEEASRTMIFGPTGFIGRFVAEASLDLGRPTYLLVRSGPATPSKANTLKSLQEKGAIIIYGTINDQDFMEKVLKEHKIEVVISAVGGDSILDQLTLVEAIKAVGTIKRLLPSEFGHDIDRANPVEPGLSMYKEKRQLRRSIEEAGIPYTYICCNSIAGWPYHDDTHPADVLPPLDQFLIYGDGMVKAYFVAGTDIGKFTIKSMDDPRTLNKIVHFRPAMNELSINELATLWEAKIGRALPRVTMTEDDLLAAAKEKPFPQSVVAAITHDIFIKGCQVNYSLDKLTDVEVSGLYPDTPFRSVDECFNDFHKKMIENPKTGNNPQGKNGLIKPNSKQESIAITATCS